MKPVYKDNARNQFKTVLGMQTISGYTIHENDTVQNIYFIQVDRWKRQMSETCDNKLAGKTQ